VATNSLTSSGLTIQQVSDIVAELTDGYTTIYGADINLDPDTQDGQSINIFATAVEDGLELLQAVYNMFSPANAFGVQLDNLFSINGMQRQQGTYTLAQVAVTATLAVSLIGQDALASNPNASVFTLSDQSGNQFQLKTSYSFGGAGTETLTFVAVTLGQIATSPNTITIIITPFVGISGVNNPSVASDVIGTNEESDVQFKVRQGKSFQLAATGPNDALQAQLLNLSGVVDAFVPDNDADSIVSGVFSHGILVVVNNASAADSAIAQAIYAKKGAGAQQTAPFTTTGTTTNTEATVTSIPSTANMAAGMGITGTGIPSGTTISSVDSATQVTMSANATASGSVSITISPTGTLNQYNITRPAGNVFTASWYDAVSEDLYISFTIKPINGTDTFNTTTIAASLASALVYKLNQSAFVGQIINAMNTIAQNAYITTVYVGTSSSPAEQQVSPSDFLHYFSVAAANIAIST